MDWQATVLCHQLPWRFYHLLSTFSFKSVALLQHRSFSLALAPMVLSVVLGLVAVVMGMALAKFF